MYEGLNWNDAGPDLYSNQEMAGAGDSAGMTQSFDPQWMDWSLANMDGNQFGYQAPGMSGYRGEGASLDNDALYNYLNSNNLQLKEAGIGGNQGYRAAFNKDTGKMQGSPTFYDLNDNVMQAAMMLAAPMIAPASIGSALGLSGGLGSFVGGGLAGATSSMLANQNPLQGFALSGLGSFMPDVAGYAGVSNPVVKGAINSGLKGGLNAAIQGGDVGTNALYSGLTGGLNGLGGTLNPGVGEMPDVGTIGGELFAADGPSYAGTYGQSNYTPTVSEGRRTAQSDSTGEGGLFDSISSLLFPTEGKGLGGSNLQFGDLAQGLMGLYGNYRQRKDAKSMLSGLSGRRDAYGQNLQRSLQRRDAASGRRSDYAGRDVQLQAALAELDSRNSPMISQLNAQKQAGLAGMFQGALRMGGRAGVLPIGQPSAAPMPSMSQQYQTIHNSDPYSLTNTDPRLRRFGG